jgi:hypothetical protein
MGANMSKPQLKSPRILPPDPLRGSEPDSFAEHTISVRLPGIVQRVLDSNNWSENISNRLKALIDEMPYGELTLLDDPDAPDDQEWSRYMTPYLGRTWMQAPWFVVEMYLFRRILKATGYFQSGDGKGIDPYLVQKRADLPGTIDVIQSSVVLMDGENLVDIESKDQKQDQLVQLLQKNIWGNQADLSLWPSAEGIQPERPDEKQQIDFLIDDDANEVSTYLFSLDKPEVRVDFILDNVGLELAFDLLLADFLLSSRIVQQVHFNVKPYPTYVSDATREDVLEMLSYFEKAGNSALKKLANRLERFIAISRFRFKSDYFWVSPLSGWEMPAYLYQELSQSDLIISKGDANYRRWLGDRRWPVDTPLDDALSYLPAPWTALRVLKSEIIAGLAADQAVRMDQEDPTWMFNGRWGVIQFVPNGS